MCSCVACYRRPCADRIAHNVRNISQSTLITLSARACVPRRLHQLTWRVGVVIPVRHHSSRFGDGSQRKKKNEREKKTPSAPHPDRYNVLRIIIIVTHLSISLSSFSVISAPSAIDDLHNLRVEILNVYNTTSDRYAQRATVRVSAFDYAGISACFAECKRWRQTEPTASTKWAEE